MQWTDGRPSGYTYWSDDNVYVGPQKIKTQHSSFSKTQDMVLVNASKNTYPWHINDTLCTALVGTPGAYRMTFVSIKCDLKLHVSGILCIEGGKPKGKITDITYNFSHWFPWVKPGDIPQLFPWMLNINLVNSSSYSSESLSFSEESRQQLRMLRESARVKIEEMKKWHTPKWKYEVHYCHSCSNASFWISGHVLKSRICSICKAFKHLPTWNTTRVIHLSRQLVLPLVNTNTKLVSVERFGKGLRSTIQCEKGELLLHDQCVRVVRAKNSHNNNSKRRNSIL